MEETLVTIDRTSDLAEILKKMGSPSVKVGWFETAQYDDGTYVAYVAAIQEFGSPENNIPPRPFLGPTSEEYSEEWAELLIEGTQEIFAGNETVDSVLGKMGLKASGDVAKTITEIQDPPLKQSTIDARLAKYKDKNTVGNLYKPLVDTGLMLASVSYVVGKK